MKSSILATATLLTTICLATPALSADFQPSRQIVTAKQRVISGAQQSETPLFKPNIKPAQVINSVQVAFPAWPGWFPWQVAQPKPSSAKTIKGNSVAFLPAWPVIGIWF